MQVSTFAPSAALARFVEKLSIVESHEDVTRSLLPDRGLIVGVRFAGAAHLEDTRLPDAAITGIQASVRPMRTAARSGIVLAHFRPGGAAACFRVPVHELFGTTLALDTVLDRHDVAALLERVGEARTNAERVAIVDAALAARARDAILDRLAAEAARRIAAVHGRTRIAALAAELGISQDPLEKRFRRAIGTSPKHFAMLARVRHAIDLATDAGTRRSLSRVALDAAYYDQSHFNREIRAVTGQSPKRFFAAAAHC